MQRWIFGSIIRFIFSLNWTNIWRIKKDEKLKLIFNWNCIMNLHEENMKDWKRMRGGLSAWRSFIWWMNEWLLSMISFSGQVKFPTRAIKSGQKNDSRLMVCRAGRSRQIYISFFVKNGFQRAILSRLIHFNHRSPIR